MQSGSLRHDGGPTVAEAAEAWLVGARAGQVRNRSGDPYKPSAIRAYAAALELRVLPALGDRRLQDVRRADLQRFVDQLVKHGLAPPTVMTTLLPLRAIYRRALARGEVSDNPTRGLEMPAIRREIRYVSSPEQAERLLDALAGPDRVLWATATYAGLRRGELTALRFEDVDLAAGVIHVRRGWDQMEGEIATKSREGRRKVPVPAPLGISCSSTA
jgi:integrase